MMHIVSFLTVYQTHRGPRRIATGATLAYIHIKASNWSESNGCSHASPRPDHPLVATKQHNLTLSHNDATDLPQS